MKNVWFVSRQCYWGVDDDECWMVEIALGGTDYANADMLVPKYEGEGQEYTDPREAVEAALEIRDAWQKDEPKRKINVGEGCTGGDTMPFEGDTDEALRKWSKDHYETLPRCDQCGDLLPDPDKYWFPVEDHDAGKFCREYCVDKWRETQLQLEET